MNASSDSTSTKASAPSAEVACIFCKIARKQIPATILYETNELVAFPDASPKAPVHVLIVPKRHIDSLHHATPNDRDLLGNLLLAAQQVALLQGVADGYQLLFNVGKKAGQTVDHIHLHVMGGKRLKALTE